MMGAPPDFRRNALEPIFVHNFSRFEKLLNELFLAT